MAIDRNPNLTDLRTVPEGRNLSSSAVNATAPARTPPALDDLNGKLQSMGLIGLGALNVEALAGKSKNDIKILQTQLSAAGLYVPEDNRYYADGHTGGLTNHGLALAADPKFAASYIANTALRDNQLDKTEIMKLQASLNRLGYEAGEMDGKIGKKTAGALRDFLKENPEMAANIDPSLRTILTSRLEKGAMSAVFEKAAVEPATELSPRARHDLPTKTADGKTLLHPDLIEQMRQSPMIRNYVAITFEAAEKNGLDGNMLANQYYKESLKLYDPDSRRYRDPAQMVSPVGAVGLAQIMPGTARELGLTRQEMRDPWLSADAGARYVRGIMDRYNVTQDVALIGYNAGPTRVAALQRWAGREDVTIDDYTRKMEQEREAKGITHTGGPRKGQVNMGLERVQTYDYVREIVPHAGWSEDTIRRALSQPENKPLPQPDLRGPIITDELHSPHLRVTQNDITLRNASSDQTFQPSMMARSFGRAADLIQIADITTDPTPTTPKGREFSPAPSLA